MQLSVTGRHVEVTEPMKQYAQDKAGKLIRYYDRIDAIEVVVDHEAAQYRVEMLIRTHRKQTFVGHVDAGDFYEALDLLMDKMGRQLTRHKEKTRNRKHPDLQDGGAGA